MQIFNDSLRKVDKTFWFNKTYSELPGHLFSVVKKYETYCAILFHWPNIYSGHNLVKKIAIF